MNLQPPPIPSAEPIPLPAPAWILELFLLVTFLLHIVAMNCVVGGSFIALVARLRSSSEMRRLANDLARKIPALLAATITLGIAPLLFVQTLYGQFFYSSSALMAWPWFAVILILTVAYYGFYVLAFHAQNAEKSRSRQTWIALGTLVLVLTIAFIYTNNLTLMLQPETWMAKYRANTAGLNLNLGDPSLLPRYFHTLIGATAIGGLFVVAIGLARWKSDRDDARFLMRHGAHWFVGATVTQFIVGTWFLIALPYENMLVYLGGRLEPTALFFIAIAAALSAVFAFLLVMRGQSEKRMAVIGMTLAGVVMVAMDLMRDVLRRESLALYLSPESFRAQPQWDVLGIFLALFAGSVALWVVMLRRYFRSAKVRG